MDDPAAFFERHRARLRAAAREGHGAAASFIDSFSDPAERRTLYFMARRELVIGASPPDLDTYLTVARAGIAEVLRQAEEEQDASARTRLRDLANAMSYNLAADLADCWPGDDAPRSRAHFEAGLAAANDCVRWRDELDKPPSAKFGAWWAKGMHELSLGLDAVPSFNAALAHAKTSCAEDGDDENEHLAEAYLGLAEWIAGGAGGRERFDRAAAWFADRAAGEGDGARDARYNLAQVQKVRDTYAPTGGSR